MISANSKQFSSFQRALMYLPVKSYFVAFCLLSVFGYGWVIQQVNEEPSAFNDILTLTLRVAKWVLLPVIAFGFLSVFVPFVIFWLASRRQRLQVLLQSPAEETASMHQQLQFSIMPLWQPVLGQLYYRLVYQKGEQLSPKFSLVRKENGIGYAGNHQEGWYRWPLPGIKEYEIDTMVVYFEDIFHFFSLTLPVPVHQSFFTKPGKLAQQTESVQPTKTENENIKIDDWRKVQGEFLNYKHFETNDDVRRIVWKIYARSKELVVRTPEIMDPYASHVGLYISFYTRPGFGEVDSLMNYCLDYYKTACWSIYNHLEKTGLEVRYFKDQELPKRTTEPGKKTDEYYISVSQWQRDNPLQTWVKPADASLVCISSLSAPEDLAYLLANAPIGLTIALVPLTQAIQLPKGLKWLRWLWIEQEKDPIHRQQIKWFLSPMRKKIAMNEEKLQQMIDQSGVKQLNLKREA